MEESGDMKASDFPMAGLGWPQWIKETITFVGITRLPDNATMSGAFPSSYAQYEYGYACNASLATEEGRKKNSIDISWAVNKDGNKANLPGIDFVKVYTGVFQNLGMFYGYSWANIAGATDCHLKGEDFDSDVE